MSAPGRPKRESLARSDKAGLIHAPRLFRTNPAAARQRGPPMNPWDLAMLPAPARLRAGSAPERPWPRLVSRPAVPMPVPGVLRARGTDRDRHGMDRASAGALRRRTRGACAAPAARHLSDPVRGDHRGADDRPVFDDRHARALPALELRQASARPGAHLQEGHERSGVRDRHQHQPVAGVPDGNQHAAACRCW